MSLVLISVYSWTQAQRNISFCVDSQNHSCHIIASYQCRVQITFSLLRVIYLHGTKTRVRWAEGFHDELNCHVFDLERNGLRQVVLCPWLTMRWQQATIPYRIGRRLGQEGPRLPRTLGRRCRVCYWCIIKYSRKRQHHHRHLEHKDIKSWRKLHELTHEMDRSRWTSLDTVKWDGRTLAKRQQRKDTSSSVEKRINASMAFDFLFTRTSWTLSWDVARSPAGWSSSAWGQSLSTSQ